MEAARSCNGRSQRRVTLGSTLRVLVGVLLLGWLIRTLDVASLGSLFARLDVAPVAAACVVLVSSRWLTTWKWQVLLRAKDMRLPFAYLLRVVWISNFFGHFLPSAIGGDNIRMFTVARQMPRPTDAVSTVLMERLTGTVALSVIAVLGGAWSYLHWGRPDILVALLLPVGLLVAGLAGLWTEPGEWLVQWLLRRLTRVPGHRMLVQIHAAVQSYRHHRGAVTASVLVSGAIQALRVFAVYLVARAMGLPLRFHEALALVPAILFISMLPISIGGLGVREGAFIAFLRVAGLDATAAFGLSLVSRLAQWTSNLPGWALFVMGGIGRVPEAATVSERHRVAALSASESA